MKIIDKKKDYYDYFQGTFVDNTIVFDRRKSVLLTNDDILWQFPSLSKWDKGFNDIFFLLQVGFSNWLIKCICTDIIIENNIKKPSDYKLELIEYWKDYNHCYLSRFGTIKKDYRIEYMFSKNFNINATLLEDVKHGNYSINNIGKYTKYEIDTVYIFNNTKLPSIIDGFTLYQSFEEYFSHLKDDINCDNMTNQQKIDSHGFDKYSFTTKKGGT